MTSRTVHVPKCPSNILSLCSSATDTIRAIGGMNQLAAIEEYGRIIPGIQGIPVIGRGSAISSEEVIARKIDLAFVWWYQEDVARQLEGLGVPTVRLRSGRATEVPGMIRLVGSCLGRSAVAERIARDVESFMHDHAAPPSVRPRVYLELYSPFKTSGSDTYANDLIEMAGGSNVAAGAKGSVLLSPELLIQADPEVILFINESPSITSIQQREALAAVKAVRSGRVYPVDRTWLVAGPGMPQAIDRIKGLLQGTNTVEDIQQHGILQSHL